MKTIIDISYFGLFAILMFYGIEYGKTLMLLPFITVLYVVISEKWRNNRIDKHLSFPHRENSSRDMRKIVLLTEYVALMLPVFTIGMMDGDIALVVCAIETIIIIYAFNLKYKDHWLVITKTSLERIKDKHHEVMKWQKVTRVSYDASIIHLTYNEYNKVFTIDLDDFVDESASIIKKLVSKKIEELDLEKGTS